jgi:hypothetical protein
MSVSYLAFVEWPAGPVEIRYAGRMGAALRRALEASDPEGRFRWREEPVVPGGVSVGAGRSAHRGPVAVLRLLRLSPAVYFLLAAGLLGKPLLTIGRNAARVLGSALGG